MENLGPGRQAEDLSLPLDRILRAAQAGCNLDQTGATKPHTPKLIALSVGPCTTQRTPLHLQRSALYGCDGRSDDPRACHGTNGGDRLKVGLVGKPSAAALTQIELLPRRIFTAMRATGQPAIRRRERSASSSAVQRRAKRRLVMSASHGPFEPRGSSTFCPVSRIAEPRGTGGVPTASILIDRAAACLTPQRGITRHKKRPADGPADRVSEIQEAL